MGVVCANGPDHAYGRTQHSSPPSYQARRGRPAQRSGSGSQLRSSSRTCRRRGPLQTPPPLPHQPPPQRNCHLRLAPGRACGRSSRSRPGRDDWSSYSDAYDATPARHRSQPRAGGGWCTLPGRAHLARQSADCHQLSSAATTRRSRWIFCRVAKACAEFSDMSASRPCASSCCSASSNWR